MHSFLKIDVAALPPDAMQSAFHYSATQPSNFANRGVSGLTGLIANRSVLDTLTALPGAVREAVDRDG